jgi:DNA polymerase I-like protein with 3'-5' exonuclease and polymerase domains
MYSPHDQLPAPNPKDAKYSVDDFYNNTAKYLIKDTVRVMDNGLAIDIDKVIALEEVLQVQLDEIDIELASNPLINAYLEKRYVTQIKEYKKSRAELKRSAEYYKVEFKSSDMFHRSYFMDEYAKTQGWSSPKDKLTTGVAKWPATLVKKYAKSNNLLRLLLADKLPANMPIVDIAMDKLAADKANIYNSKYLEQIKNPDIKYPVFNPGSSKQKQELFDLLCIPSEAISKDTGLPSWNREQVERIHDQTSDKDVKNFTLSFIDHSFAAVIKNNFIEAFYNFTVDGRLYGSYNLLGAKTGRYTSSSPNMLNMPSTKSRFSKHVKKCFIAPKGKIILTADYSALEDRVIASLSKDPNKCDIFLKNLDGHSLNAIGYFKDKIKDIMVFTGNMSIDAVNFKKLVDIGNKLAEDLRQESKGPTFGLAYGAFPPKIAATLKISLDEAQDIFDNYHNVLYPGITDYRENSVLPTAIEEGQVHLGLGFFLKTDNPSRDIRTLANATCQFWSILTALTINKMHQLIDENGYQNDVKVISTIYDSIYFEVTKNASIIKWVNDNLIKTMVVDFMIDQTISNEAESDIGYNWADMTRIPNNATIEEITSVLIKLDIDK